VNWDREQVEQDRRRYQLELDAHLAAGLTEEHPIVERLHKRLRVVNRMLTDPAFGLTAVPVPHPTCIDATAIDQTPRSEWTCGPECPKEA
jgi:hypothetical protein